MKAILSFALACLATVAHAETLSPEARTAKLRATPVTVYPRFDARGSALVTRFNTSARADDALVVSHVDALKSAFRVADLGLKRGQVWVYVAGAPSLGQTYREQVEGIGGVVYVPDDARKTDLRYTASMVAQEAQSLRVPLIVGLDDRDMASLGNVDDIARNGDVLLICASSRLKGAAAAYRSHLERVIAAAREANPRIKIELGFVADRDPATARKLIELALATIDLGDRVAVFCENTPESLANLDALLAAMRS